MISGERSMEHEVRNGRILVADDSASSRELLRCILARCGWDVVQAEDGEEVLRKAPVCLPDLFILDLNMPALDGYTVAYRLRQQQAFRQTPILALSGGVVFDDPLRLRNAGFSMAMAKPVTPMQLRTCVADLLQAGRPREGHRSAA